MLIIDVYICQEHMVRYISKKLSLKFITNNNLKILIYESI